MRYLTRTKFTVIGLGFLAAVSLGVYLIGSGWIYRIGFPLDDAWIHQTYARNLGTAGAWEFLPGQPSAGSTAPSWTLLLSIGYWLGFDNYFWTFLLGWGLLWALAVIAALGFKQLEPRFAQFGFFAGVLVIFEWHITWAAGSGMETLLAALVALVVVLWTMRLISRSGKVGENPNWAWFGLGALIGFGVWVRPDVITLLAVAGFAILLGKGNFTQKLKQEIWLGLGVLLLTGPYLLFNLLLAGDVWPNTFYAKQAEYAVLRDFPLWQRYLNVIQPPLTGVGIILLPGFLCFGYHNLVKQDWVKPLSFLWVCGYILVYAVRLPVSYQHGRYLMPVIPVFCLLGLVGAVEILVSIPEGRWRRLLGTGWALSGGFILIIFWILGMRAYAMDVALIESEMVSVAYWLEENTEVDSLIAAHDIGAIGFFAERNLVDLAGLVSPEVIPIIREETALEVYMNQLGADYLVTFPQWYPELVKEAELIFQTDQPFSVIQGGENMAVYRWKGD
ncbi:MAG: hypothetical protein ACK2UM_16055 [Anaerolineales bacterium]